MAAFGTGPMATPVSPHEGIDGRPGRRSVGAVHMLQARRCIGRAATFLPAQAHNVAAGAFKEVVPRAGTLVLFRSKSLLHEVRPSHTRRIALSLWLLGGPAENVPHVVEEAAGAEPAAPEPEAAAPVAAAVVVAAPTKGEGKGATAQGQSAKSKKSKNSKKGKSKKKK